MIKEGAPVFEPELPVLQSGEKHLLKIF